MENLHCEGSHNGNSHFDNGICNGAISISKQAKFLPLSLFVTTYYFTSLEYETLGPTICLHFGQPSMITCPSALFC